MDPPYLHHSRSHSHNQRYSPISLHTHPPPPPPHHSYPEKPIFYRPYRDVQSDHRLPPPPPPPQLPPPPFMPRLAPRMPHQPQSYYSYPSPRPYEPNRFDYSPPQPRSQQLSSSGRSQFQFDSLALSPRVLSLSIGPTSRNPGASPGRYRQFDHKRVTPVRSDDRFRNELEGSARFRDEYRDRGFARENIARGKPEERYHHAGQFVGNSGRSSRDFVVPNRSFDLNSGNHDRRYSSAIASKGIRYTGKGVYESPRRVDGWQANRDTSSSTAGFVSSMIVVGGGTRGLPGRVGHSLEFERSGDNGSIEGSHEYSKNSGKQMQKKSALLRIQTPKPNHMGRGAHDSRNLDTHKSNSRSRDQIVNSDREVVKEGDETHMDLDVSFKSNVLVAKAIVAQQVGAQAKLDSFSCASFTPRPQKVRKSMIANKLCKTAGTSTQGDRSKDVTDADSISIEGLNQCKENVIVRSDENKFNTYPKPSPSWENSHLCQSEVENVPTFSDKAGCIDALAKSMKKKQVRKKILKKVVKPFSQFPTEKIVEPVAPSEEKILESVEAGNHSHAVSITDEIENSVTSLVNKVSCTGMPSVELDTCANGACLLPEKGTERSSSDLVSEDVGIDIDSGHRGMLKNKRKRINSSCCLVSTRNSEILIGETGLEPDNFASEKDTLSNNEVNCEKRSQKAISFIDRSSLILPSPCSAGTRADSHQMLPNNYKFDEETSSDLNICFNNSVESGHGLLGDVANTCSGEDLTCKLDMSDMLPADKPVESISADSSEHGVNTPVTLYVKNSSSIESTVIRSRCCSVGVSPTVGDSILNLASPKDNFSETDLSDNRDNNNSNLSLLVRKELDKFPNECDRFSGPAASAINIRDVTADILNHTFSAMTAESNDCTKKENVIFYNLDTSQLGEPICLETADSLNDGQSTVNFCSVSKDTGFCPSSLGSELIGKAASCIDDKKCENDIIQREIGEGDKIYVNGAEGQIAIHSETAQCKISGVDSCSANRDLAVQSAASFQRLGLGCEQVESANPSPSGAFQEKIIDLKSEHGEKIDEDAAKEKIMSCLGTFQSRISLKHHSTGLNKEFLGTHVKANAIFAINDRAFATVGNSGAATAKSGDDLIACEPTIVFDTKSPKDLHTGSPDIDTASHIFPAKQIRGDDEDFKEISAGMSCPKLTSTPSLENGKNLIASNHTTQRHSIIGNSGKLPVLKLQKDNQFLNSLKMETHARRNHLKPTDPKSYRSSSSFVSAAIKNVSSSNYITKPRTWHRSVNAYIPPMSQTKPLLGTFPHQGHMAQKATEVKSTYIRKGNSLLRKPASGAILPRVSQGLSSSLCKSDSLQPDVAKGIESDCLVDVVDPPALLKKRDMDASYERPGTPPSVNKVANHAILSSSHSSVTQMAEHATSSSNGTSKKSIKSLETSVRTSCNDGEDQTTYMCQNGLNDVKLDSSDARRITYVKRNSNLLVATKNDLNVNKAQVLSSDGYYKKRKHQLVRTSGDGHLKEAASPIDNALNAEGKVAPRITLSRNFSMRRSCKVARKAFQRSKFSLVWTLHGGQSSSNQGASLNRQKVLPRCFPLKRSTYLRNSMPSVTSVSSNSSSVTISKKLLLRKRDVVYMRSNHGFSLRKSKVLNIAGSHLKWSKSMEKESKRANEEATHAVAAAEKKKRERCRSIVSRSMNRTHSSRERIFRVGSVRYKMDSSRRTLQRISDDDTPCSGALLSKLDAKKSFVPRRVVIGNDEYVRVGNGHQLVRDPKKRIRVLASEKVRWSLHAARSRLARKQKYCQFFTRFGKCNKDEGKCPYIHDSSKILVCTKYLNGLCLNSDCKLTHKVIPERMPDCCYFSQGWCTNEACPYRHVHVNPNAATCEGFLKGYCADGNECRKKHSYVCPVFEATGICLEGSKCKLHHPKKQSKGIKRKRSPEHGNDSGRYFGTVVFESHCLQGGAVSEEEGGEVSEVEGGEVSEEEGGGVSKEEGEGCAVSKEEGGDYISLNVSDDEVDESDYSESQLDIIV